MKWLHISDLHFGKTANGEFDSMWKKLPEIKSEIGLINYLFITGDLRYGHEVGSGYPSEVEKTIKTVQSEFRIEPGNTFVVPGNHDVNQGNDDAEKDALTRCIDGAKKFYQKQRSGSCIPDVYLTQLKGRKKDFYTLRKKLSPHGEGKGELHFHRECDDCNIIGLDTAIVSGTTGDRTTFNESGTLILDMSRVRKVFDKINSKKPTIVLAHHDPRELNQTERRNLENLFADNNVILYLCGHSHLAKAESSQDRVTTIFTAGTFKGPESGRNYDFPDMDILVGEIKPNETGEYSGYVKAYRWDYRVERWFLDPAFSCRSATQYYSTDGIYYFPRREKSLATSSQTLESRYLRYLMNVCGKADLHGSHSQNRSTRLCDIFISPYFQETDFNTEKTRTLTRPSGISPADVLQDTHSANEVSLKSLLSRTPIRTVVFSNPGGGKSTLLKWIAQDQAGKKEGRRWLPVWLRSSDFRESGEHQASDSPKIPDLIATAVKFAGRQAGLDEDIGEPVDYDAMSFVELVQEHTRKGTALFLIDGLDEISDADLRKRLFDQLQEFLNECEKVNLILTLRDSSFHYLEDWGRGNENEEKRELLKKVKGLSMYRLAPLVKDDIRTLCQKWFAANGTSAEEGLPLAETIIQQEHTSTLAVNPLMLTLMLLVRENHEGWLPDTPVSLYAAASSLLLERWTSGSQMRYPLDLEEIRYQLSFIAFSLQGTFQIPKSQLIRLLENIQERRKDLVYRNRDVSKTVFFQMIDNKNALLLRNGIVNQDKDRAEDPVYMFQHRVFWEYFSAYAVDRNCYEGYKLGDRPLDPFRDRLWEPGTSEIMHGTAEIILLAAAMDPIRGQMLAHDLTEMLNDESLESDKYLPLKRLLLRFLIEEVRLDGDTVWGILEASFKDGMTTDDPVAVYHILHGRYSENLRKYFIYHGERDHPQHGGGAYWMTLLDMLEGKDAELRDVWQFYWKHLHDDPLSALTALASAIWMNQQFLDTEAASRIYPNLPELDPGKSIRNRLMRKDGSERACLVDSLLSIALHGEMKLRWHALRALHQGYFQDDGDLLRGKDFPCYLQSCVEYMNLAHELPLLHWYAILVMIMPVFCREYGETDRNTFLTEEAQGLICTRFEGDQKGSIGNYEKYLSFFCLAIFGHTDSTGLERIFHLILREQSELLKKGHAGEMLYDATFQFAECLDEAFLGNRYEQNDGESCPIKPYEESLSPYLESCIYRILDPIFQYEHSNRNRRHIGLIDYCPSVRVRFEQPDTNEEFDVDKALRIIQNHSA